MDNGLGTIEDCDIYSNTYSGVNITVAGNPTISQCRIYDGKNHGIYITDNGLGTIEDCDIYSNTDRAIAIVRGSNPTISRCRIYDGKNHGIYITDNGLGIIEDCDIYRNAGVGVMVWNKSNPTLRRCHIYNGKQQAILIHKQAQGSFQHCKIERHLFPGIKIGRKCQPTFRRCTLKTIKPSYLSYLGLVVILSLGVALPLSFPFALDGNWTVGLIVLNTLVVTILSVYSMLYKRGFEHKFIFLVLLHVVLLGFNAGMIVISYNISDPPLLLWLLLLEVNSIIGLVLMILYPALGQAKLMSNYGIKPIAKNQ